MLQTNFTHQYFMTLLLEGVLLVLRRVLPVFYHIVILCRKVARPLEVVLFVSRFVSHDATSF
jgi:hypothetical protein